MKNTATGIGRAGTWWYLGPKVDALQWPTSADWVGNVRPGLAGPPGLTLETPKNPSHTLVAEGTLTGTPFASGTWGLIY